MRLVLVGAGGVGGHLIRGLAPMLEFSNSIAPENKTLVIVDGDTFEPHNSERQDFEVLGPKPEVRVSEIMHRFPMVNFVPINKWVVEKHPKSDQANVEGVEVDLPSITADELLQDGDVVICVVDNFACRATLSDAASKIDNIDLIHAGNDDAFFCSYYHYQRRDGEDITMNPSWKDEFANPTDRNPGEMSCEERARIDGGTQIMFTNMAIAAIVGAKVSKIILDDERVPNTDEFFMDIDLGRARSSDRTKISEAIEADEPKTAPLGAVS